MTPGQRLMAALQLYYAARDSRAAMLRSQHPDWSEERIARELREWFERAAG